MAPSLRLHQDNLGIWGERRSSAQPAPPHRVIRLAGGSQDSVFCARALDKVSPTHRPRSSRPNLSLLR